MPAPDEVPFDDDDFNPDTMLWSPGVDYVDGWRDATDAAAELSESLEAVGIDRTAITMRADASPDGAGVLRMSLSSATARRLAALAREAAAHPGGAFRSTRARPRTLGAAPPHLPGGDGPGESRADAHKDLIRPDPTTSRSHIVCDTTSTCNVDRTAPAVPADGDAPADGASERPGRAWTIVTTDGHTVSGYLPEWVDDDPSETGVPPQQLPRRLVDIGHFADFDGQDVRVVAGPSPDYLDDLGKALEHEMFRGTISCRPFDTDPALRVPVADIDVLPGYTMDALTPDDLTDLATKLRAQADRLEHEVRPKLVAARDDWTAHHPA
jgi:hypothetical protein